MSSTERSAPNSMTTALAEIEFFDDDGVRVVAVAGELDISNVGALEQVGFGVSNQSLGLVVDLTSTDYIDSSTVGLLFSLREGLNRRGQLLCLVCTPGSNAYRVLDLVSFAHDHTYEQREAAVAAIRQAVPLHE
ncbi:MAG: STAS domain-containing protein [Solirubrobacteraceae bacterium]